MQKKKILRRERYSLPDGEWLKTHQAADALSISRVTLLNQKKEGKFVAGEHYIRLGDKETSPLLWNIPNCRKRQAMFEPPQFIQEKELQDAC